MMRMKKISEVFSRDQGFGEKIENIKELEYVAKFMFSAYAIT